MERWAKICCLVFLIFLVDWFLLINIFRYPVIDYIEGLAKLHGGYPKGHVFSLGFIVLNVLCAPIFEECFFRGFPLLIYKENGYKSLVDPIAIALGLNLLWACLHILNTITFPDGHKALLHMASILFLGTSGLFQIFLTFYFKSIVPSIISHALWNLSIPINPITSILVYVLDINTYGF